MPKLHAWALLNAGGAGKWLGWTTLRCWKVWVGKQAQTLRRDSCWCSGYLKSKYLKRKRKEEKKSIKKKKICWFVQLYQFTAFLHLPWKLARQCTVNVKHCRLVTASFCFFKFQSQTGLFFFFFPFLVIFPKGQRQSYSSCEEAELLKGSEPLCAWFYMSPLLGSEKCTALKE